MQLKFVCENVHSLDSAAAQILSTFSKQRVFALFGKMGAGKTTFIKTLCHKLHVKDVVNSPTFAIVNEYLTLKGESIFHFDFGIDFFPVHNFCYYIFCSFNVVNFTALNLHNLL